MFFGFPNVLTSSMTTKMWVANVSKTLTRTFCTTLTFPENAKYFKFSEEQTQRILHIINSKSISELRDYDIPKTKLNKIEAWKQKNGIFNNLDDILHLDGFSVKVVEKFCNSLLGEVPMKRTTRKTNSFVTPSIPDVQISEIKSSVSISVSVSTIVWSRLELNKDGPCTLTHWQKQDIKEQKLHLHELINQSLYMAYMIPQADCYLFENPQIAQSVAPGNAEQVNINVQKAQLTAMLGFALASRNLSEDKTKLNVFYLRRFLAARLFQNLVGSERVSAEKAVLNLMRTCYNPHDMGDAEESNDNADCHACLANVTFPNQLRQMYKAAEGYHREFLGQTLLLNLAFVRLVLLRDATSIAIISRNSKQSETE